MVATLQTVFRWLKSTGKGPRILLLLAVCIGFTMFDKKPEQHLLFVQAGFILGLVVIWKTAPQRRGDSAPSDIRGIAQIKGGTFDPSRYWSPAKGVFLGLDQETRSPAYVPPALWLERHMQVVGPTGSGKGVLLGNLAAQAVQAGNGLVFIDPKRDGFIGHILADACAKSGRTLHVVDLQEGRRGGWHPFRAGREHERLSRVVECFGLTPTGNTADFYRIESKELLTRLMADTDGSLGQALTWLENDAANYSDKSKIPGALERNYFKIWAGRKSLNPPGAGFNLNKALAVGDVILLRSDPNDTELTIPLKAFLMQIVQWKFQHPDSKQLTVIADEVSLYVSSYLAQALATIRSTNTNFVLAYQSVTDLETAQGTQQAGRIIRERIDQNCQLKLFYGTQDNLTVKMISEMSGTKQVWSYSQSKNLTGHRDQGRSQREEALIPANVIRRLGQGVAVYFEPAQLGRLIITAPVKTAKGHDLENDPVFHTLA